MWPLLPLQIACVLGGLAEARARRVCLHSTFWIKGLCKHATNGEPAAGQQGGWYQTTKQPKKQKEAAAELQQQQDDAVSSTTAVHAQQLNNPASTHSTSTRGDSAGPGSAPSPPRALAGPWAAALRSFPCGPPHAVLCGGVWV